MEERLAMLNTTNENAKVPLNFFFKGDFFGFFLFTMEERLAMLNTTNENAKVSTIFFKGDFLDFFI